MALTLPSQALQTAYYNALNGAITYNATTVPVYDVVPADADYPYIRLADQIVREASTKNSFSTDIIIQVDVVTGFEGAFGGKQQMWDIASKVVDVIRTRSDGYLSVLGYTVYKSELDISTVIEEQTDTHNLYINRIRFRHLIQQT